MAYKTTVAKACATREIALAELWAQLAAMGWSLIDGNCTPVTVAYTAVSIANDTITAVGHTFVDGQPVQLVTTGTAPGGLAVLTQYYVVNVSGNTFKLSATYNGTAINITSQGTGNHTITESFRVYSSNGEAADQIIQYIKIAFYTAATAITTQPSYGYDVTTHALIGAAAIAYAGGINTNQTGFYLWIHGDKTFVDIVTKISTTYDRLMFGFVKPFLNTKTSLTGAATAGSSVSISVTSTDDFEAGSLYQIVGAAGEGRDQVTVESITNSTTMVVTTLLRNYGSGSQIGDAPCMFGNTRVARPDYFHLTNPARVAGTADTTQHNSGVFSVLIPVLSIDPDDRSGKYVLQPFAWVSELVNASSTAGVGFYVDSTILLSPGTGLTAEDTFAIGKRNSGTSSGTNSSTVLNDTAMSWTVNAYANKALIITFGTGIGQIKKIASNTATALTLAAGWTFEVVPDATSQYIICNEGFRYLPGPTTYGNFACKEGA